MGIEYRDNVAKFFEDVSIDEAEGLFEWLQTNTYGLLDLSCCTHLHASVLQLLMAANHTIVLWPENLELGAWLQHALSPQ